jgi:hypothetical protein
MAQVGPAQLTEMDAVVLARTLTVEQLEDDPYPLYARWREDAPVVHIPVLGLWFVTRWADAEHVTTTPDVFEAAVKPSPLDRTFGGTNILTVDGTTHKRLRNMLLPSFRPPVVERDLIAVIEPLVREQLDRLGCGDDHAELMEDSEATLAADPELQAYDGRQIVLGVRPEGLGDAALGGGEHHATFRGRAELREALGSEVLMHFSVRARAAITQEVRELAADVGDDRVSEQVGPRDETTLVGRFSPRTRIREGDLIDVTIDESALHFFDPATGAVIHDQSAKLTAA